MSTSSAGAVSALCFDFGNVLHWFDYTSFFDTASASSPYSTEELRRLLASGSTPVSVEFESGRMSEHDFLAYLTDTCKIRLDPDELTAAFVGIFAPNEPVLDLVDACIPNYRCALLSNTNCLHYERYMRSVPVLERMDEVVLSYEVGAMKPAARPFEVLLERIGYPADRCVFVDDRPENVETARRLGFRTIEYAPATDLAEELARHGAAVPHR